MKKRRRRILCAVLSVVLVLGSFRIAPMRYVKAAAISVEASAELTAFLWNLMVNSMIVSGADKLVAGDYETEKTLFENFMDTLANDVMGIPEAPDYGSVTLSDGSTIQLLEFADWCVNGTGALQIPTEEEWAEFRVVDGGGGGESPEDPEEPEENFFTQIQQVVINSGLISKIADFGNKLWNGGFEDVDLSQITQYAQEYVYTGELETDELGNYLYQGKMGYYHPGGMYSSPQWKEYDIDRWSTKPHALCLLNENNSCCLYELSGEYLSSTTFTGSRPGTSGVGIYQVEQHFVYANFPIFNDATAALNYLKTGDDTGCLNGLCYDFPGLVNSLLEVLHPLTGINLNPAAMPGLRQALSNAHAALPVPGVDPAVNTENYKAVMEAAVGEYAAIMPEPVPLPDLVVPEPVPEPEPEPEPEPAPEPVPENDVNVDNYKLDLKQIFPFCIPFDFIALLDALDAEPEAPKFEVPFVVPALGIDERYVMDLSMFDEQMALLRKFETVGFIILLMHLTHKFIKW